jgi:hydroxymethylbilane synthase
MTTTSLTIGTRTSALAMWQTQHVEDQLQSAWPDLTCELRPFVTQGDKTLDKPLPQIGGKGLFTAELERALLAGDIDLAVHSLKDLPLGAIGTRADVRDVLVSKQGLALDTLPAGALVGTSSLRRRAQLLHSRQDVYVKPIRGNVDTRIRKVMAGEYDAAVLAAAGVTRLGLDEYITQWLSLADMLPAPGQGALAIQCRADDARTLRLLAAIDDPDTRACVTAERAFLHGLDGGCSTPVAAYATIQTAHIHLTGLVASVDGAQRIRLTGTGAEPFQLGVDLAQQARREGAQELLVHVSTA